MDLTAHSIVFWLCLVILFPETHSSEITKQESSFVKEVIEDLSAVECDMVVVAPSPLPGRVRSIPWVWLNTVWLGYLCKF